MRAKDKQTGKVVSIDEVQYTENPNRYEIQTKSTPLLTTPAAQRILRHSIHGEYNKIKHGLSPLPDQDHADLMDFCDELSDGNIDYAGPLSWTAKVYTFTSDGELCRAGNIQITIWFDENGEGMAATYEDEDRSFEVSWRFLPLLWAAVLPYIKTDL